MIEEETIETILREEEAPKQRIFVLIAEKLGIGK
jgi:hypothetical protein